MNSRYFFALIACAGAMIFLIFCGIAVFVGVQAGLFSDTTATPTIDTTAVALENQNATAAARTATAALTPSPQPTSTPLTAEGIAQMLNDSTLVVEGVRNVRAVNVTQFDDGWIVFMEVDTYEGYNTAATADIIHAISDVVTDQGRVDFSVVLWDRITSAINFTWDTENEAWLTTMLSNNPG